VEAQDEAAYLEVLRDLWREAWPRDAPREPHYPFGQIPLTDYLRRWAAIQPRKAALIYYGAELSYGELDRLSDAFAAVLARDGIVAGDRVGVMTVNCPQFVIAFFAILKLGAIHVPVSPMLKAYELEAELTDAGVRAILVLDTLLPVLRQVQAATAVTRVYATRLADMAPASPTIASAADIWTPGVIDGDAVDFLDALAAAPAPPTWPDGALDAVAALNYTGGTTGLPKGCAHSQRDMIYTAATTCPIGLGLDETGVSLCFYPAFWIAGEDLICIFPIFTGSTCVLLARWDPVAVLTAIERYRVSHTGMLVDNVVALLEHPRAGDFDLTSLRTVRVSSFVRKLNREIRRGWRALTGADVIEATWGMTETHTCDTFTRGLQDDDFDLRQEPVFVGLPLPGTEFKICDFETGALKPLGEDGELCIRSPSLFSAYWNAPEATAEALRDGWLHSGDVGLLDRAGYLRFLGRRKEMIKVKGMSVFPAELEAVLGGHPDVLASGVIARPDAARGEVPVAFVLLAPGAAIDAGDLAAWCRARLSDYKAPEIRIVDDLPMTATGKVRKIDLHGRL
ncbi:MAG: AMP-binding enzyme family protein, partial [Caulobacteraceae bacterium]|nr:AMP-binding enzyme family protein [Caulobacteraceae bacterium]